jgi:hypothetical protein
MPSGHDTASSPARQRPFLNFRSRNVSAPPRISMQAENDASFAVADAGGAGAASADVANGPKAAETPATTPLRHTDCGEATTQPA